MSRYQDEDYRSPSRRRIGLHGRGRDAALRLPVARQARPGNRQHGALSDLDAITQLDTSVMAFDKDGAKVKADTENLCFGRGFLGRDIAEEALGLQTAATSLTTSGQKLLKDVLSKKAEFEASDICEDVQSKIASLGSETQSFVDAIIKQLPEESQQAAKG
ncbi:hypothetical protein RRF57_012466 [Xylaria bambusicola]|uniref:Uncharacterized protein n=1 Tax=Xylaria bambusicola TaxID=326684 RepID=A0AAN7V5N5_9PEZI